MLADVGLSLNAPATCGFRSDNAYYTLKHTCKSRPDMFHSAGSRVHQAMTACTVEALDVLLLQHFNCPCFPTVLCRPAYLCCQACTPSFAHRNVQPEDRLLHLACAQEGWTDTLYAGTGHSLKPILPLLSLQLAVHLEGPTLFAQVATSN